jgi:enoyl-CoA hydratase
MNGSPPVTVERPVEHVARITVDRPPVNALDRATQRAVTAALTDTAEDLDVRAVVLAAAGTRFCGGADLAEEQALDRDDVGDLLGDIAAMLDAVRNHRAPVVAAVNGAAFGGGLELALACDIRIAARSASFGAAGVNVGLVASFRSLTRAIGDARARHLLLTGWTCPADQALEWGLVTEVVDDAVLAERAVAVAARIATRAPLSVESTKECLNRSHDLSDAEAAALQGRRFARLFRTEDHAEALRAFFERRPGRYERR